MKRHNLPGLLAAMLTILAIAASPARTLAQGGSIGISLMNAETTFRPEFSPRDIRIFERVLGLKPDEKAALQALYAGYVDGLKSRSMEIKRDVDAALERAEVMQDRTEMAPAHARIGEWQRQAEQMKSQFLDDLKSLLTREQEQRWPIVERELRRVKRLSDGRLAGERVDLTRVLEEMLPHAADHPEIQDLLERYCEEMDRAIVARDEFTRSRSDEFFKATTENPARGVEIWNEAQRLRLAVRDVNDRYVRLLATALGGQEGEELTRKVFEISHERALKPSKSESYIRAAAKLGSLSPEQSEAIAPILDRYERERWALVQRLAKAEQEDELTWMPTTLAKSLGKVAKDAPDGFDGRTHLPQGHPLLILRKQKYELDRGTKEQVEKLLEERQRQEIPVEREGWAQFLDWTPGSL